MNVFKLQNVPMCLLLVVLWTKETSERHIRGPN